MNLFLSLVELKKEKKTSLPAKCHCYSICCTHATLCTMRGFKMEDSVCATRVPFFSFLFSSFFSARVMHDGRGGQRVGRGREEGSRQTLVLEGEGVGREREKIESERDTFSTFLLALLAGNYFIAV